MYQKNVLVYPTKSVLKVIKNAFSHYKTLNITSSDYIKILK